MADDVYMFGEGSIELNEGQRRTTLTVQNTGDRAVQIGSHFHFFEVNRAMKFDREKAFGMRLDIPAGTAVRFEAGDTKEVALVEYGGGMRLVGFAGLLDGSIRSKEARRDAIARMRDRGYTDEPVTAPAGGGAAAGASKAAPRAEKSAAKKTAAKKATARKATAKKAVKAAAGKRAPAKSAKSAGAAKGAKTAQGAKTARGAKAAGARARKG